MRPIASIVVVMSRSRLRREGQISAPGNNKYRYIGYSILLKNAFVNAARVTYRASAFQNGYVVKNEHKGL